MALSVVRNTASALPPDVEEPDMAPDVSVVIVVVERPESLVTLYEEYNAALRQAGYTTEFIFAALPYFRDFTSEIAALEAGAAPVRLVEAATSIGETALLRLGAQEARGRVIIVAPAYHQIEPTSVVDLVREVEAGADLAIAERWPRHDSVINRMQHDVLHVALRRLCGDGVHDVGCGVRAMRGDLLQNLPLYGDFARFLPFLAMNQGYAVKEVRAPQHPNDLRRRVYGPGIYGRRMIDVLGLSFLLRFTDKPLRFFGLVGAVLGIAGTLLLLVLLVQRVGGEGVADRPMLLLSVLLVTLGVQAIALGLIGEMIVHFHAARHRRYRLRARTTPPTGSP